MVHKHNRNKFRAVILGARTRREIELRVTELEHRLKPTVYDFAELARLRELLRAPGGEHAN